MYNKIGTINERTLGITVEVYDNRTIIVYPLDGQTPNEKLIIDLTKNNHTSLVNAFGKVTMDMIQVCFRTHTRLNQNQM